MFDAGWKVLRPWTHTPTVEMSEQVVDAPRSP
jgi:hypothetical protein